MGQIISTFSTGKIPYVVRLNPDKQNVLLAGTSDKKIVQWDINTVWEFGILVVMKYVSGEGVAKCLGLSSVMREGVGFGMTIKRVLNCLGDIQPSCSTGGNDKGFLPWVRHHTPIMGAHRFRGRSLPNRRRMLGMANAHLSLLIHMCIFQLDRVWDNIEWKYKFYRINQCLRSRCAPARRSTNA
ncbi:collinsiaXVI-like protein [Striga asiatica]|uniref:CollinsiaXVI-like protein n=1 Tax=Striga asiatica TaxID=4170 RepID=A0A5A7PMV6_STRAF|nr:collinsiaXVI-like protein [Striga asiatica]